MINRIRCLFYKKLIKKTALFDPAYYLSEYPDVRRADIDPLTHFLMNGWKEGRNPSAHFNTSYYLEKNPDVAVTGVNPLIHYIKFGAKERRSASPQSIKPSEPQVQHDLIQPTENISSSSSIIPMEVKTDQSSKQTYLFSFENVYRDGIPLPCTDITEIVICVGKSPKNVLECLPSIREFTQKGTYIIHLVTDINDLKNIEHLATDDIIIHTHEMSIFNYSIANNLVLRHAKNDVVLLNDDTVVTEGWLEKLRVASKGFALTGAHTMPHRSGNPDMWGEGKTMVTNYPINMFCAFIPRRVQQIVGVLDEEFYYYGGEDVDYSIRARLNGFPLVVSDAFVEHKDNQSFGETKMTLMAESDKILFTKYGAITPFDLSSFIPLVSIIIASYKRGYLLESAIKSIYTSEYENFEVIIVDDGSPDDTPAYVLELQKKYDKVKYLRLEKNQGLVRARAAGMALAKGQFIFFTDDDDTVLPNRISSPLKFMSKHQDLDVVYCDFNVFDGETTKPMRCASFDRQKYLDLEFNIGSGILFARTKPFLAIPFYPHFEHAVDYDWVFRFVRAGYKLDYCPEIVMNYNRSGSVENHLAGTQVALDKHKEVYNRELLLDTKVKRKNN